MALKFQSLPVNTMVGASWKVFNEVCKGRRVDPSYKKKYICTKVICRILSSINCIENARYNRKFRDVSIEKDPVFIIGHWRSGTTYMHNVFACDKQFGYTTTYQTVFPYLMLFLNKFFKLMVSIAMPKKRPTDNLELNTDQPQEEEFAMANMTPYSFYNFWILPEYTAEYRDKYLLFNNITEEEKQDYDEAYTRLIKLSLHNTNRGGRYLSKNPPNTGRVAHLLKLFPNAKFIYLVRNPYTVYESTYNYFTNTILPLKLQDYSNENINRDILETYSQLYDKYESDKLLIPEGNLVEMKFEDFEANPLESCRDIYKKLSLPGFDEAEAAIAAYTSKKKSYKKNKYNYAPETIETVNKHWSKAIEQWGYKI